MKNFEDVFIRFDRMYDFANSLLIGTSGRNMSKLQRVQNCLARVVLHDN